MTHTTPEMPRLAVPWSDVVDQSLDLWENGHIRGDSLGWMAVDKVFRPMPNLGELTVVTGIPGGGKSEWMDHVAINLSQSANWKWAVFSPENYPVSQHVAKLAEKIVRKPFLEGKVERMTKDQFLECLPFVRDHFTFLDPDYKDPEFLMAAALNHRPLTKGFGIILDPWNTFEHKRRRDETETEYVGRSLTFIINEARAFGAHVFLVAHPQKMQRGKDGKYPVPGPWDISGSAHWFNKPDNIICVHRDKTDLEAPVEIHVQKVRRKRIGHIGLAELAYDRVTGRYSDVQTTTAEDYANRRER